MARPPRNRRPKRSTSGEATQLDHKLSKRARELYVPGEGWSEDDEDALREAAADLAPVASSRPSERGDGGSAGDSGGGATPLAETADAGPLRQGRIVALWSGGCRVETAAGEEVDCVLPSRLAQDQQATVAVGDRVSFAAVTTSDAADRVHRLREVLPRRSRLSRPDPTNPHLERVIAANVDVVVVVASLVRPPLRPALVDRYLIAVERGGAAPVVALNKVDLASDAVRRRALATTRPYRELGIPVVAVSAATGEGLAELRRLLAGHGGETTADGERLAAFVGHSGVGKSSLLNALEPAIGAATAAVDERLGKGRHTTTSSSLHRLGDGLRVIDTPGIRELGLWQMSLAELREYFPDLQQVAARCRFADCTHSHEPGCAVLAAVAAGEVDGRRLETYRRILESLTEER